MKLHIWTIFLFLFYATALAQDELKVIKPVAPATYPPAARAVRATGEVGVSVEINAKGEVVSAKAFSGHPLLRAVSENAARLWQFSEIAKGPEIRTTLLFFKYEIGGLKRVEESEKSEEAVINSIFPTMFSAEVSYDSLVPRLLLLPREKDVIKPTYCRLHDLPMSVETLNVTCTVWTTTLSNKAPDESTFDSRYKYAEEKLFPNANAEVFHTCGQLSIEQAEVYFCPICRAKREDWLRNNK